MAGVVGDLTNIWSYNGDLCVYIYIYTILVYNKDVNGIWVNITYSDWNSSIRGGL